MPSISILRVCVLFGFVLWYRTLVELYLSFASSDIISVVV